MLTQSLDSMSPKEGDQLTLLATLPTLRGTTVPLLPETQRSLWVFFSTGCIACMQDLPSWEQLEQSLAAEGTITRFLSIDNETDARRAVGRTKVELSLAPKDLTRTLRLDRIPYYILVGPEGRIEWAHRGRLLADDKEVLLSRLKQHLVATLQ